MRSECFSPAFSGGRVVGRRDDSSHGPQVEVHGPSRSPWTHAPARLLFLSMLVVPTIYQTPKAVLLAGVVLLVLANGCVRRREACLHRAVVVWVLVFLAVGLLFMLRGAVRGEPGALRVGTVYVLWPAVFGLLMSAAPRRADIEGFVRLLVPATMLVSLLGLGMILEKAGYLPGAWFSSLPGDQGVGLHEGFVELRMGGLGTLVFSVPFLLATLACGSLRRPWLWLALALGLILVGLSGRRVLMLLVAVSPVLIVPFVLCLPATERARVLFPALRVLGLAALAGALVLFLLGRRAGIDLDAVWQMFSLARAPRHHASRLGDAGSY